MWPSNRPSTRCLNYEVEISDSVHKRGFYVVQDVIFKPRTVTLLRSSSHNWIMTGITLDTNWRSWTQLYSDLGHHNEAIQVSISSQVITNISSQFDSTNEILYRSFLLGSFT